MTKTPTKPKQKPDETDFNLAVKDALVQSGVYDYALAAVEAIAFTHSNRFLKTTDGSKCRVAMTRKPVKWLTEDRVGPEHAILDATDSDLRLDDDILACLQAIEAQINRPEFGKPKTRLLKALLLPHPTGQQLLRDKPTLTHDVIPRWNGAPRGTQLFLPAAVHEGVWHYQRVVPISSVALMSLVRGLAHELPYSRKGRTSCLTDTGIGGSGTNNISFLNAQTRGLHPVLKGVPAIHPGALRHNAGTFKASAVARLARQVMYVHAIEGMPNEQKQVTQQTYFREFLTQAVKELLAWKAQFPDAEWPETAHWWIHGVVNETDFLTQVCNVNPKRMQTADIPVFLEFKALCEKKTWDIPVLLTELHEIVQEGLV